MLFRSRFYLSSKTKLTLYYSLIYLACVASVSVAFFAKKYDFRSFGRARNGPPLPSPASFAFLFSSQFPRGPTAKNDTETLATQAIIYPYITYCNSTWSSTYVTNLNRIYCLQKRAVRAITNSDYRAHSAPLFSKLGILNINQINTFQIAKFMYCYHNNLLPPLFFNLFFTNNQIHGYSTRTANNYRVNHCRTNLKKFTILFQGPKIWNSLPVTITSLSSFPNFKKILLQLLPEFLVK